jgi:hypothetical protein
MLVIKKSKRLYNDIFFTFEGGHLLNVNRLIQTLIKIDWNVNNVVQLVKRCQSTIFKNIKRLLSKENYYELSSIL